MRYSFKKLQEKASMGLFLVTLVAGVALTGCHSTLPSAETSKIQQAESLYHEAWQMVKQDYVDPSFNGQQWDTWKDHYQGRIHDVDDSYVAIQTMLASLNDDYTRFLPPRDMSEQTLSIDSKLYGVGIQISLKDKKLLVVTPIPGTPAAKAGIRARDYIIRINGHQTAGMSVEDAADQIRGPEGSKVNLTIQRGNRQFSVILPRAEIKIKSVFTKEINPKEIGYIRLNSFISENANQEMADALHQVIPQKKALILDLRGNYGGLLNNAVEIADMFLDEGEIVSIVDREKSHRDFNATMGEKSYLPMVILIDGGSASASEILSGALHDHHRATLIGTKSFGKGLVQKINLLQDGSGINITISKYLTPNGTDINKKGITPDMTVPYTEKDFLANRDPQLDAAIRFLKKKMLLTRTNSQVSQALGAH